MLIFKKANYFRGFAKFCKNYAGVTYNPGQNICDTSNYRIYSIGRRPRKSAAFEINFFKERRPRMSAALNSVKNVPPSKWGHLVTKTF
jgi:hypothetical protein